MSLEFSIRPVQDGDQTEVLRLLTLNGPGEIPEDDLRHPVHEAAALVAAGQGGWLAIADGRPVGLITSKDFDGGVVVEKDYSSAGGKGYKGIGAALVRAREDYMRGRGETEALAHIKATNAASLRMFSKLGYQFDAASQAKLENWRAAGDQKNAPVLVLTKKLAGPPNPS